MRVAVGVVASSRKRIPLGARSLELSMSVRVASRRVWDVPGAF